MEQSTTTENCGPPVELKEEETNPQIKVVRSTKFWFEDGNVVIQAEHTQFRLHRSVLSIHCPIFRDMFACSLPENGPTVDGCPLVHLSETLEDVRNFIKIIYRSIKTYNRSYLVTVSLLKTMLHFGKKYEMKEMRQEAIQCLKTEFPSTLHHWSKHIFGHVIEGVGSQEIPTTSLFEILYLAHEHSVTSILPALYLHICLTHNADDIAEGFESVAKKSPCNNNRLLIDFLLGREHLHRSISLTHAWLYDNNELSSSDCKTKCYKIRFKMITKLWNNDILFSLNFGMLPWDPAYVEGLCHSCSQAAEAAYSRARITNWDELKTYFNIADLDLETKSEDSDSFSDSDSDSSHLDTGGEVLVEDESGL